MHIFPLKSPKFSEILVSKKKYKQVLVEESLESKNSKKINLYSILSVPFHSSNLEYFTENWFCEREI